MLNASTPLDMPMFPGEVWLSDPNNRRVVGGMEFVRVPAGQFIMGHNSLAGDEQPQHTIEIPYDYWIGKYPVTNEQFVRFVAAANYNFDHGGQGEANRPVDDVNWYDATAYCHWLNDLARGELKNLTVRLPTEAEWEKAARGRLSEGDRAGAREWPWGDEFDKDKCNCYESGIGRTTPVGAYSPQGDSPYGAADMAGNVWEWCHSLYEPYPYQVNDGRESASDLDCRVVRGGGYTDVRASVRCASRDRIDPHLSYGGLGFRVVIAPPLPE